TVNMEEKQHLVDDVFHSVAQKYDLMNDVLSMGLHRLWKREAIAHLKLRPQNLKILDLASGTGDLVALMHKATKGQADIVMTDINESMLNVGRKKLIDKGILSGIEFRTVDA